MTLRVLDKKKLTSRILISLVTKGEIFLFIFRSINLIIKCIIQIFSGSIEDSPKTKKKQKKNIENNVLIILVRFGKKSKTFANIKLCIKKLLSLDNYE